MEGIFHQEAMVSLRRMRWLKERKLRIKSAVDFNALLGSGP